MHWREIGAIQRNIEQLRAPTSAMAARLKLYYINLPDTHNIFKHQMNSLIALHGLNEKAGGATFAEPGGACQNIRDTIDRQCKDPLRRQAAALKDILEAANQMHATVM